MLDESVAAFSAAYSRPLCAALDGVFVPQMQRAQGVGVDSGGGERPPHVMLSWCEYVVWSLRFQEVVRCKFARSSRMNMSERRVFRTLAKFSAKTYAGCRVVFA